MVENSLPINEEIDENINSKDNTWSTYTKKNLKRPISEKLKIKKKATSKFVKFSTNDFTNAVTTKSYFAFAFSK